MFDTSADTLFQQMPAWVAEFCHALPEMQVNGSVYVVGGIVRDALLKRKSRDVDLVVEGFAARDFTEQLGLFLKRYFELDSEIEIHCHDEFGTCTVTIGDVVVDIAQARAETYPHPASLPLVSFSTLKDDLKRRDFTINAFALELYPNKGTFHDPFSGLADLEKKSLRILHDQSFIDDPTRIIRGARLAGRLAGHFDSKTKDLVPIGLADEVLEQISPARLRAELELCLQEAQVLPSIKQLFEIGALKSLFVVSDESSFELIAALDEKRKVQVVEVDSYLLALFLSLSASELKALLERYNWSTHYVRLHALLSDVRTYNSLSESFYKKVNDDLYGLNNPALCTVIELMSPEIQAQVLRLLEAEQRPKLTGHDVLNLMKLQDPEGFDSSQAGQVGDMLLAVVKARALGQVSSYDQEISYLKQILKIPTSESGVI